MAARNIAFDPLDPASVAQALADMQKFQTDFMNACNDVIIQCVDRGYNECRTYIGGSAFYTGELQSSIRRDFDAKQRTGRIYTDSTTYAEFVEYGTGLWGQASPHPEAGNAGWGYDVNNHGMMGWMYYNPRDGWFHWSTGVNANVKYADYAANPQNFIKHLSGWKARPFMYTTRLFLENEAPNITASVFAAF